MTSYLKVSVMSVYQST